MADIKRATTPALAQIEGLPTPPPGLFFYGRHNPSSEKQPLIIELHKSTLSNGPIRMGFSRLLGHRKTVADEGAVIEAAKDLLAIAARVDEFVGIFGGESQ